MAEQNMSKQRPPRPETSTRATPKAASRETKAVRTRSIGAPHAVDNVLQAAVTRLEGRVAELKLERDAMAAELTAAKAEIAALNASRIDAANRIDWVLDTLQSVLEEKS